jgi:hypothetical protein
VREAAVDAVTGALRALPWFSRVASVHRLGLAPTSSVGMRLAELGIDDAEDAPAAAPAPPEALSPAAA